MSRLVLAISNVHMLEGDLVGADGPASVFVDASACRLRRCRFPASRGESRAGRPGTGPPPPQHRITIRRRLTGTRRPSTPI